METDKQRALDSWRKFLNPLTLRSNLIQASIFLAAWETFRSGVIGHLEGFYGFGYDEKDRKSNEHYLKEVLSLDKSKLRASLLWFKQSGVVSDADLALVDRVRQHRNEIAHNLPAFVAKVTHDVDVALLFDLCNLLNRIDIWWIRNVEIPTNPDFDDQDVDAIPDSEIRSGSMLFLGMIMSIALGEGPDAKLFYDEFERASGEHQSNQPAR